MINDRPRLFKQVPGLFAQISVALLSALSSVLAQTPPQAPLTDFGELKDGDIVFIESNSVRAPAIKALTGSILTHCGIVFQEQNDKWIVFEGAGYPGTYRELGKWITEESGGGKHPLYVRRLTNREGRLGARIPELRSRAKELHDTSYDKGFAWENKDKAGQEYIYCSELVWKAYKAVGIELGKPHPLSDYIDHPPAGRTSADVRKDFQTNLNSTESKDRRNGQDYKPIELAISPKEVFESGELEPVIDAAK